MSRECSPLSLLDDEDTGTESKGTGGVLGAANWSLLRISYWGNPYIYLPIVYGDTDSQMSTLFSAKSFQENYMKISQGFLKSQAECCH